MNQDLPRKKQSRREGLSCVRESKVCFKSIVSKTVMLGYEWNRIESPYITPCICANLIYDRMDVAD